MHSSEREPMHLSSSGPMHWSKGELMHSSNSELMQSSSSEEFVSNHHHPHFSGKCIVVCSCPVRSWVSNLVGRVRGRGPGTGCPSSAHASASKLTLSLTKQAKQTTDKTRNNQISLGWPNGMWAQTDMQAIALSGKILGYSQGICPQVRHRVKLMVSLFWLNICHDFLWFSRVSRFRAR